MHRTFSKYLFYLPATLARGEQIEKLLAEKRTRQFWTPSELARDQARQLHALLTVSGARSGFYRKLKLAEMPPASEAAEFLSWFTTLPMITKRDLIDNQDQMRTHSGSPISQKTTGGSTGEPVRLWKDNSALAHERAATWRAYEWAGIGIGDPQLRFWGVPHGKGDRLKARLVDMVANRRRISAFALDEASLFEYYRTMSRFRPAYLYGYASVIHIFAQFLDANRLSVPSSLRAVISTSEVLTDRMRSDILHATNTGVFNEYGCGEVGSVAHECRFGSMHIMADNIMLELVPAIDGKKEIVVTDLHNFEMPLIRYRLGDFASSGTVDCPCGVTLPALSGIHGRAYDVITTQGGRTMHPEAVMYLFETLQQQIGAFRHFQVIQRTTRDFDVKVVPTERWTEDVGRILLQMVRRHIAADATVKIELVSEILRERSGKLRVVKSLVRPSDD